MHAQTVLLSCGAVFTVVPARADGPEVTVPAMLPVMSETPGTHCWHACSLKHACMASHGHADLLIAGACLEEPDLQLTARHACLYS